ncbi:MAG: hypothetical protein NVSMB18_34770 [Acetobacteraceae bacterium]
MSAAAPRRAAWLPRAVLLATAACLVGAFFAFGLHHAVTLEALQSHRDDLMQVRDRNPVLFAGGYLLAYLLMAALAIPGALVISIAGGAVFGLVEGTVLASFGSSLGATLALLASRYLLRGWMQRHFQKRLEQVNRGLARDGWLYLLSLRLVPAIPFFVVNLLFGVTAFPVLRFYAVSQVAMLPVTLVYVNAGTQLEHLTSLSGILSPGVLISMILLACLPVAARRVITLMVKRR